MQTIQIKETTSYEFEKKITELQDKDYRITYMTITIDKDGVFHYIADLVSNKDLPIWK